MKKLILSLYDYSGNWSQPYKDAGYKVVRMDIAKDSKDIRLLKLGNYPVYGILAAPPCTVFANSGNRWARTDDDMRDGLSMIDVVIRLAFATKPKFWVLENPVGKLIHYLGPPKMRFDPCDYGDPYTKKTCLWGKFRVPKINWVEPYYGSMMHYLPPSIDRARKRSETPKGFAKAFFEANR